MSEQTMEMQAQEIGVEVQVPVTAADVVPLNYEMALASFPEAERQEIVNLANSIDVRKIENVMNYGAAVLRKTFEQCGAFLKEERGSQADQRVIEQVRALSKKASESYEDFNLVLQEPGAFQKFFMRIMNGGKSPRTQKIQNSAVTSYKLLVELKSSCDFWLDMMKKAYGEIERSARSESENIEKLEKYIIAGQLALPRIEGEMQQIQETQQQTGLQRYAQEYEALQEGYKSFKITLANLEKSRAMYYLSIGQLFLICRGNRNVQTAIHTQVDNSMALIGQQLRNAVLDAKTREVLEGQKAIARLSDELIKEVSKTVGLTAEDTEKLIYAGFYNPDAGKEALITVINCCHAIEKTAEEMLPKMQPDSTEINGLVEELKSCIGPTETLKIESGSSATASTTTGLKF